MILHPTNYTKASHMAYKVSGFQTFFFFCKVVVEITKDSKAKDITVSGVWLSEVQLTLLAERGGLMDGEWHIERKVVLGVALAILEVEFS